MRLTHHGVRTSDAGFIFCFFCARQRVDLRCGASAGSVDRLMIGPWAAAVVVVVSFEIGARRGEEAGAFLWLARRASLRHRQRFVRPPTGGKASDGAVSNSG